LPLFEYMQNKLLQNLQQPLFYDFIS